MLSEPWQKPPASKRGVPVTHGDQPRGSVRQSIKAQLPMLAVIHVVELQEFQVPERTTELDHRRLKSLGGRIALASAGTRHDEGARLVSARLEFDERNAWKIRHRKNAPGFTISSIVLHLATMAD